MGKKVLISGYYGFGNLGDEAILEVLVDALKTSGHRVTVLSTKPDYSRKLHGTAARHRMRELIPALLSHDVVISGGGGLLQDKTSRLSLEYYLGVLRLAKVFKRKVIIYGQSLGPLSRAAERSVMPVLKNPPIAVRDARSQRYLLTHGISSTLVADPALLLTNTPEHPPQQTANEADKPLLIIPRGDQLEIQASLERLIASLSADRYHTPALAVMPLSTASDNEAALRLQRQGHNVQMWHANTPELARARIASARAVLSVRLHGLILAAAGGIAYSGIVYDPKVAAFLDETVAPRYQLPQDDDALLAAARYQPEVDWQRVEVLKARAQAGLSWLHEQLEQP